MAGNAINGTWDELLEKSEDVVRSRRSDTGPLANLVLPSERIENGRHEPRPSMTGGEQGALDLEAIIRSAETMRTPLQLSVVRLEDYGMVYLPGGHGPMQDLCVDADAGRILTCFTNDEEEGVGLADRAQWLLETELQAKVGVEFSRAGFWQPYIIEDRNLLTGQNLQSAQPLAERLLEEFA